MKISDVFEYLESKEGRKEVFGEPKASGMCDASLIINDVIEEIKYEEALIDEGEYIEWLENFIRDNQLMLSIDSFIPNLNEDNKTKVIELPHFYKSLIKRIGDNFNVETEQGNYYKINYNDKGYLIGININPGVASYCYCIKSEELNKSFADYQDILDDTIVRNNIQNVRK